MKPERYLDIRLLLLGLLVIAALACGYLYARSPQPAAPPAHSLARPALPVPTLMPTLMPTPRLVVPALPTPAPVAPLLSASNGATLNNVTVNVDVCIGMCR
jgi:hypothetical protein